MRSEKSLFAPICAFARENALIRAVYLHGLPPGATGIDDPGMEAGIVFVVTAVAPFIEDRHWISLFGQPLQIREPDSAVSAEILEKRFSQQTFHLLLETGARLDASFVPESEAPKHVVSVASVAVLLDKDKLLPAVKAIPVGLAHSTGTPTCVVYRRCCDDFWWATAEVARALRRRDILHAVNRLNEGVRPELVHMLVWAAARQTHPVVPSDENGQCLERCLPRTTWERFLNTYSVAEPASVWQSLYTAGSLFHDAARQAGAALGYPYNRQRSLAMGRCLVKMRQPGG